MDRTIIQKVKAEAAMTAFDALPASARQALASSPYGWDAKPFLVRWKRGEPGFRTGAELVQRIGEMNFTRQQKNDDYKRRKYV